MSPEDYGSGVDEITDALEKIGRRPPLRVPPIRGARTFTVTLRNDRVLSLRFDSSLTLASEANQLGRLAARLDRQHEVNLKTNQRALRALSRKLIGDLERLRNRRQRSARKLQYRLAANEGRLLRRLTGRKRPRELAWVRRLHWRGLLDRVLLTTSLPLFAAYGQSGRQFSAYNATLWLSLLLWLFGDEIAELLTGPPKGLPYALRAPNLLSYLAPLGNLLTGWWLLDDRQHERLISGGSDAFVIADKIAASPYYTVFVLEARVDLSAFIGSEYFSDFETFSSVPAIATFASVQPTMADRFWEPSLTARVDRGVLILTISACILDPRLDKVSDLYDSLSVAWVVDTMKPSSSSSG